ncbi:hypothetical protein BKA62DRAFT_717874 [Auriculariales sp. MPI-PUGE-AT-0066]|nr:hypothetical protein BKA62DRAFT_717874 [Auriculariales sp. MPI-PUGE-AT-0066]
MLDSHANGQEPLETSVSRRHPIWSLPFELLQVVFGHVTVLDDTPWDENHPKRASKAGADLYVLCAPFWLAAICKEWRAIALHTPTIWTYINVSFPVTQGDVSRISCNLERSAVLPLDIVFDCDDEAEADETHRLIFKELLQHASRWRRCRFVLPVQVDVFWDRFPDDMVLRYLEQLVVLPEYLEVTSAQDDMLDRQLPNSPCLHRLACHGIYRPSITQTDHWLRLHYLSINLRTIPGRSLWTTIGRAPNLRELRLDFPYSSPFFGGGQQGSVPDSEVCLPQLEHLVLMGHAYMNFEQFIPMFAGWTKLHMLTLSTYLVYMLRPLYARFAGQIRTAIVHYEVGSYLSHEDAHALLHLSAVQTLEIRSNRALEDNNRPLCFAMFFETLRSASTNGTALGKLRVLKLSGMPRREKYERLGEFLEMNFDYDAEEDSGSDVDILFGAGDDGWDDARLAAFYSTGQD